MKTYLAYVYKDPNSSFGVSFPDLPGCYGTGDSYDEAIENARESLREYAQALSDDDKNMPKPRTHGELASDTTEAIELNKAAFVIEVPLITAGTSVGSMSLWTTGSLRPSIVSYSLRARLVLRFSPSWRLNAYKKACGL